MDNDSIIETYLIDWCYSEAEEALNVARADERAKVLKDLYASDKSRTLKELLNMARAEGARKFAEWLTKSDYANGYFDTENGFISVDKVINKYEREKKNE